MSLIRGFSLVFLLLAVNSNAQDRFASIEAKLQSISDETPGLNEKIELSVNGVALQDFIRGIATENNINVSVDPSLNIKIVNNFSNVTVAQVFVFLCKKYDLDLTFVGSIMSFTQYVPPIVAPKYMRKQLKISYDSTSDQLSFDLSKDSLVEVAKEITRISGKNVVFSPDLGNKMVSGYIQNTPFNNALEKLAFANDFKVTPTEDNFYLIEKKDKEDIAKSSGKNNKGNGKGALPAGLTYKIDPGGLITVNAVSTPINDILGAVSNELKVNYFLFSEPKGSTTFSIEKATYEDFLKYLLNGTDFTFKKEGEIYLLGDRKIEGLRATRVVQLKYRTVEKLVDFIPADIKKDVELKTFPDLNSLILSGSEPRINEIEAFIRQVDQVVPVIEIEVIIVDVTDTKTLTTGIEAGLGTAPASTAITVLPSVDMTLSSTSINNVIDGVNGLGLVNLGKVTPNFYLSIKAMDQQGILKIRSTPKLATLNGHEATMSIGSTEYYLESSNNVIGSQNPQNIITQQYKSVNADLSVTINPIVSGDEQITMDVKVKQSTFTTRISPTAPPGTITRDFQSMVRVKNQETVILGGLEENSVNESASGLPFLSRIPIIKWFFSSRTKAHEKDKLTIFIKPTVIY